MDFLVGARLMKTWVETDEGVALINDASYPFSYETFCVCICVCVWIQPRKDKNNRRGNREFAMKHAVNGKFCLNCEHFICRCTQKKEDRISKSDELWYSSK